MLQLLLCRKRLLMHRVDIMCNEFREVRLAKHLQYLLNIVKKRC